MSFIIYRTIVRFSEVFLYVISSAKTYLMEEQLVSSWISWCHTFVIVFMVKTAPAATKMFAVDVRERHTVQVSIRRRDERTASDQILDYLSLHKEGFLDDVTYIDTCIDR